MPAAIAPPVDRLADLSDVSGAFADGDVVAYDGSGYVPAQRMDADALADDSLGTEGARLVGTRLPVSTAVGRTLHSRTGERWSVLDYGAAADGVTDDLPAFQAAILAMSSGASSVGRRLYIPAGTYRLSAPIRVHRQTVISGEAGGGFTTGGGAGSGSILLVDAGETGIEVDMWATSPPPGGDASWTIIENLSIVSADDTGSGNGIMAYGRCEIRNCYIYGFGGHGIKLDGTPPANVNCWIIHNTLCYRCKGHGFYMLGLNGNAGLATLAWAKECGIDDGNWGFRDESGLGNTYVGCMAEGNGNPLGYGEDGGPYWCATAQGEVGEIRSVYLGCYSEAGQNPSKIRYPAITIGGSHGAGFYGDSRGYGPFIDTNSSRTLRVQNAIEAWNYTSPNRVQSTLGTDEEEDVAFSFAAEGAGIWRLKYNCMAEGWWTWIHNNQDTRRAFSFSTEEAAEGPGNIGFGAFYFGMPFYTRYVGVWPTIPTEYTWRTGDILFRTTPLDGAGIGWVCVEGGTPGTWAEFGQASTSGASLWSRDSQYGVVRPTTGTDKLGFGTVDAYQPRLYEGGDDLLQILGAVAIESRGIYGGGTDNGPMLSVGAAVGGYNYLRLKSSQGNLDAFVAYNADDGVTGSTAGQAGIRTTTYTDLLLGLGSNLHVRLTEAPLWQAQFAGSIKAAGTFNAATTNPGAYAGVISGDPQILLANGTPAQSWGLVNGSGTLSFVLAGATQAALSGTKLALPASRFLELVSCATPDVSAISTNAVALYRRSTDGALCAKDKDGTVRNLYTAAGTTMLSGTATWDPPSLADGAQASTTVTVTGAALGDTAAVSFSAALPEFVDFYQAKVTEANTVSATLHNWSGATVNLASGTLKAIVWKTS